MRPILSLLLVLLSPAACAEPVPDGPDSTVPEPSSNVSDVRWPALDAAARERLLADLAWLSDDARAGRGTGTPENATVRDWLVGRFRDIGLEPAGDAYVHSFETGLGEAANVVGVLPGRETGGRTIVVTAHFDHLGTRNGVVYNGADDNASGTAALLAAAAWFRAHPTRHRIVFAALDAEEVGLQGARALVAAPPVPLDDLAVNVNMDMVGRNERGELYAAGTYHTPALLEILAPIVDEAPVKLLFGHDRPGDGGNDWTRQSDHAAFHAQGIPFVYFGVEDHDDYHRPTDDVERIRPDFFVGAVETVIASVAAIDRSLGQVPPRRK